MGLGPQFGRPSGTETFIGRQPKAEALGFVRMSLRDKRLWRRGAVRSGRGREGGPCRRVR